MQGHEVRSGLIAAGINAEMVDLFLAWHQLNGATVWPAFEREGLLLARGGSKRLSGKLLAEAVRWRQRAIGEEHALNNNFVTCYAHVFCLKYPQYKDRFEFRRSPGLKRAQETLKLREAA